jgi:hypothetical protein
MATYFNKYYFEFEDEHITTVKWRVDIMDSEGDVPTEPFLLIPSGDPIITERINEEESKSAYLIGRQITITYEYTGDPNIPLPSLFFEANERRFRVEVRRNGEIDGVYFIKPDYSSYPDADAPFTVQIKAIDGLGYASGTPFNIFQENGLLEYDKITFYEAIMTRALNLIVDVGTPINVINTIIPENIEPGVKLLFGAYIHTDIFYDFIEGAVFVSDVLESFCKSFNARCFISKGQVWFIRTQDLTGDNILIDQYTDADTVAEVNVDMLLTGGPDPSLYDVMPVDETPNILMQPAIKRAEFEVFYKSINQLVNFDWRQWDGTNFAGWVRNEQDDDPLIMNRTGEGTPDNPYKLWLQYDEPLVSETLQQETPANSVFSGDRVELSFKYRMYNCSAFYIRVRAGDDSELYVTLNPGGGWDYTFGVSSGRIDVNRSGNKNIGSFELKSLPIPQKITGEIDFPANSNLRIDISPPRDQNTMDHPIDPGYIEIYEIKLGIISMSDAGKHITIVNNNNFTRVTEVEDFTFMDSGEDGLSNTIFTGNPLVPARNWGNGKPAVPENDIEQHMAQGHIDQYQRSVTTWEGSLYSNNMEFYNLIEFQHLPGKRFMILNDVYNNRTCTHSVLLSEIFSERSAPTTYTEHDISDETD